MKDTDTDTDMSIHSLVIIGGGPAGINCAIAAQQAGLDFVILEKGYLVNSIYHFPVNMTFFSTSKKLEIGGIPFISHTEKPTRQEALEYYRRVVETYRLPIQYRTNVIDVRLSDNLYTVVTDKGNLKASFVILATGFYDNPRMLGVPGEGLPKVKHYYDDVHPYIGQKVAVVGGANSACDVALETWNKGAEVTMIVRDSDLYENVKYWILPNIKNRIAEGSIKAYFNSQIVEILPDAIIIKTPEGVIHLANDYVLAMTGYKPDYALLDKIGIQMSTEDSGTPVVNAHTLESNLPGLYLSGVLLGGLHTSKYFIENTRDQGESIVRDILLKTSIV